MSGIAEAFTVRVVGAQELKAAIGGRQARVRAVFRKALAESSEVVLARASENVSAAESASASHLATHLRVQSGTLRRRLTYFVDQSAAFSRIGSPTIYAPRHEFGFHGLEAVKSHHRHITHAFGRRLSPVQVTFISGGKALGTRTRSGGRDVLVRAFVRQANTPARPFLRPALRDSGPDIQAVFRRHIAEAVAKAGP